MSKSVLTIHLYTELQIISKYSLINSQYYHSPLTKGEMESQSQESHLAQYQQDRAQHDKSKVPGSQPLPFRSMQ